MLDGVRTIFLDLDGTLCHYSLTYEEAAARALARAGLEGVQLPPEATYYAIYDAVFRTAPDRGYEAVSVEAFARMLREAGVPDPRLARRVAEEYRRLRNESLKLYDEVEGALRTLADRFALGIVSNGPSEIQWYKVRRFHLEELIDAIVISGDVGVHKPDPAIFRIALGRLSSSPGEAIHVGDSLRDDVAGANAAGLGSVWVNRSRQVLAPGDPRPSQEVPDLRDLVALLIPTPP